MPIEDPPRNIDEPLWEDDPELDLEEPLEAVTEPRHRRTAPASDDLTGEQDAGHSWTQYFGDPVREPYGGPSGSGEFHPYGDQRHSWGRESSARREDGQLYGYEERGYGHRRDSYYARADATPWWEVEPAGETLEPARGPFAGVGPRGYKRPDVRIEEEVVQRLGDAEWVDATDIEVEVTDGVVTLSGDVETRAERRSSEDIAAEVAGVVDVINRLRARRSRGGGTS